MVISFMVEDCKNLLSKTQKVKVKEWFRHHFHESRTNYDEVLRHIHYGDGTDERYYGVTLKKIEGANDFYSIVFTDTDQKSLLKRRLRKKLKMKEADRSFIQGDDWKMYYRLLKSPSLQMVPLEGLDMVLPNPDKIRKERTTYEHFPKMCHDTHLKEYFRLCLAP